LLTFTLFDSSRRLPLSIYNRVYVFRRNTLLYSQQTTKESVFRGKGGLSSRDPSKSMRHGGRKKSFFDKARDSLSQA
jgi:hypothetical protein